MTNHLSLSSKGDLRTTVVRSEDGTALRCRSIVWEKSGDGRPVCWISVSGVLIDVQLDMRHTVFINADTDDQVSALAEYPVRLWSVGGTYDACLFDEQGRFALNVVALRWQIDGDAADHQAHCVVTFKPWDDSLPYNAATGFVLRAAEQPNGR